MLSCTSQDCYQDSTRHYMTKCWGGSWNGWRIWHPRDQKAWSVPACYDSSLDSAVLHFPDHKKKEKKKKKTVTQVCTPPLTTVFSKRVRLQNSKVPSSSRNWPARLFKGPGVHCLPPIWGHLLIHSIPPWLHASFQEWQHTVHDLSFSKTYFPGRFKLNVCIQISKLNVRIQIWMYAFKLDLLNDPHDWRKTLYAPIKKMSKNKSKWPTVKISYNS